jgi:hypothetical protein
MKTIALSEALITGEQAKKLIVAALTKFFDALFTRATERRVLNSGDMEAADAAVREAVEAKFDPEPHLTGAISSALRVAFDKLLGKSRRVAITREQLDSFVDRVAGDVLSAVDAELNSMQPGFSEAFAAVQRLRDAGLWSQAMERSGLFAVFCAAAAPTKEGYLPTIARTEADLAERGVPRCKSLLRAIEDLVAYVAPRMRSGISIDPASEIFCEAARRLAQRRKIPFGEAMCVLRQAGFTVHADGTTSYEIDVTNAGRLAVDAASVEMAKAAVQRSIELDIPYVEALQEVRKGRSQ